MKIKGTGWRFGKNINTDLIFPGRYFKPKYAPGEIKSHIMEGADPDFPNKVQPGDIIVGGRNFGCGSSREEAAICMRDAGVGALVAPSFGRIFTRNCINLGVPVITCPGIDALIKTGDEIEIDLGGGIIRNLSTGHEETFPSLPAEMLTLIEVGGLAEYTKRKIAERKARSVAS